MKAKTGLWIINGILTVLFAAFTLGNMKYCTLDGFIKFSKDGNLDKLVSICNHANLIGYILMGAIFLICCILIYLNFRVKED